MNDALPLKKKRTSALPFDLNCCPLRLFKVLLWHFYIKNKNKKNPLRLFFYRHFPQWDLRFSCFFPASRLGFNREKKKDTDC